MHEGTRCTKERGARSSIHARTRESSTSTSTQTQTRTRTRRERVTTLDSTDHRCGDDAATARDRDRDRGGSGEDARWVRGLYNRRLPRAWKSIRLKTEYKSVAQ